MSGKKRAEPRRISEARPATGRPRPTGNDRGDGDATVTRRPDLSRRGVVQVEPASNRGGQRSGQGSGAARRGPESKYAGNVGSSASGARGQRGGGGRGGGGWGDPGAGGPRRRMSPAVLGWGTGAVVVVAVLVIVLVAVTNKQVNTSKTSNVASPVVQLATHVPTSVLNEVGVDGNNVSSTAGANAVAVMKTPHAQGNGLPDVDGKPVVFYFGALYCPYCATERWGIVVALSRFGQFSNLGGAESSSTDVFPSTQTWSFHGATYTSPYIVFDPVEYEDENEAPLDPLTSAEQKVLSIWDPPESFPFLTIGTKYTAGLPDWMNPQSLQGLSRQQIAEALSEPSNIAGSAIDANANYLSAAICAVDGQKPAAVCSSSGVMAAAKQFDKLPASVPIAAS